MSREKRRFKNIAKAFHPDTPGYKWAANPKDFILKAEGIAKAADFKERELVLDIGCGPGFLVQIASHSGASAFGSDSDDRLFLYYMRKVNGVEKRILIHETKPAEPLVFDLRFDVITATWITFGEFWTFEEWSLWLAGVVSGLAPGGRCLLRFNIETHTSNADAALLAAGASEIGELFFRIEGEK